MEDRFPNPKFLLISFPFNSSCLFIPTFIPTHLHQLCVVCVHSTPTPQCRHLPAHPVACCTQRPHDVIRRHTDVATPSRGRSQGGRAVGGEARRLFDQRAEAWPSVLFRYQVFDVSPTEREVWVRRCRVLNMHSTKNQRSAAGSSLGRRGKIAGADKSLSEDWYQIKSGLSCLCPPPV